ncbi:MAG TPA: hypothetical protein ENH82_04220, partial [bacterium]|nr:hypothetical protein [bacterium]
MKYKGLTYQQHRFVDLFLKGKRQGLAYAEAYGINDDTEEGYFNAAASASKLLKNPKIMAHIDKVLTRRYKKVDLTAERVLSEIMNIAFVDIRQFYNEDGTFKEIHELTIAQQSVIEKIEAQELFEYEDGKKVPIGVLKKLVFHSKGKALEMLCKNLKLLGDNQEDKKDVNVTVNVTPERT